MINLQDKLESARYNNECTRIVDGEEGVPADSWSKVWADVRGDLEIVTIMRVQIAWGMIDELT